MCLLLIAADDKPKGCFRQMLKQGFPVAGGRRTSGCRSRDRLVLCLKPRYFNDMDAVSRKNSFQIFICGLHLWIMLLITYEAIGDAKPFCNDLAENLDIQG